MTVDDLKEQIQGVGRRITDRLEEIPAYVQMKERFEGLTPPMQKLTVLAVVVVGWLIVLSIPWGWSSESSLSIEGFESRRALIRDLLKVSREAAEVPNIPPLLRSKVSRSMSRTDCARQTCCPNRSRASRREPTHRTCCRRNARRDLWSSICQSSTCNRSSKPEPSFRESAPL